MFRHVVLFAWTDQATDEQKRAVLDRLAELPGKISEIRSYSFGADVGLGADNFDLAIVADFDDREAYVRYRDNDVHRDVVRNHVQPILERRAAVQYEVDG